MIVLYDDFEKLYYNLFLCTNKSFRVYYEILFSQVSDQTEKNSPRYDYFSFENKCNFASLT